MKLNKKFVAISALIITIISIIKFTHTDKSSAILTINTENNKYSIETQDKIIEKGSFSTTTGIGSDTFYNITSFINIDSQNFSIINMDTNPGDLHIRVVKYNDGLTHYSNGSQNLTPGHKWTTSGNLDIFTQYIITAKASAAGLYKLILNW
jgi:hypothetical protein